MLQNHFLQMCKNYIGVEVEKTTHAPQLMKLNNCFYTFWVWTADGVACQNISLFIFEHLHEINFESLNLFPHVSAKFCTETLFESLQKTIFN